MKKSFWMILMVWCLLMATISVQAADSVMEKAVREPQVSLKGKGKDSVTMLVYMNGSDLESDSGEATLDLSEMINAGDPGKVNVLIQTMGTKKWSGTHKIASNRSQIYQLTKKGLKLVKDDLGQLDCTKGKTLKDFVNWGVNNYPADRYILQFWDHGGGAVYGFGYDEYQGYNESLTMDEIQEALRDCGAYFDFIGMDCCIMSSLEVCCALYDFCDYVILSEDFESGIGWYYTNWLKKLYQNTSIPTKELGQLIVDDMVEANARDRRNGDKSILAMIDEGQLKVLMTAWMDFAYENEKVLLNSNYSQQMTRKGLVRVHPKILKSSLFSWWEDLDSYSDSSDTVEMSDYYVTDIMAVAQNIDSSKSAALSSAVANAIVYMNATSGDEGLTGLAVTLPYGDTSFYSELKNVFMNCGIDQEYVYWLQKFTKASGSQQYYDYNTWEEQWSGWDEYEDDYDWSIWDFFTDDEYDDYWEEDNWGWSSGSLTDTLSQWLNLGSMLLNSFLEDDSSSNWWEDEDLHSENVWYDDNWNSGEWGGHHGWW